MNLSAKLCALTCAVIGFVACNHASSDSGSTVQSAAASATNPPSSCIDKSNVEHAYQENVLYAIAQAGYPGVTYSAITKTVDDFHDPEYDVKVSADKKVHVTCDDSGDDQCGCDLAP